MHTRLVTSAPAQYTTVHHIACKTYGVLGGLFALLLMQLSALCAVSRYAHSDLGGLIHVHVAIPVLFPLFMFCVGSIMLYFAIRTFQVNWLGAIGYLATWVVAELLGFAFPGLNFDGKISSVDAIDIAVYAVIGVLTAAVLVSMPTKASTTQQSQHHP